MDDQHDDKMDEQSSWDQPGSNDAPPDETARPRAAAGREMLAQLQQMIDTLAMQAAPVMREVAAKAAELAAMAGTKAGPLAHKAAGVTESVGQRVAARSKEMAADLRRPRDAAGEEADGTGSPSTSGSEEEESVPD